MEKEPNENVNKLVSNFSEKKITRKEAIRKAGLVAVSATTMMVLLGNKSNAMTNPEKWGQPGKGHGHGHGHGHGNGGQSGPTTSPGHP